MNKYYIKFPQNFFWGASTSSHQVEGNNYNDWSEWEKENALKLAKQASYYFSKEKQKEFKEMLNPDNYISGRACDHYNLFLKDFKIAK
jgi:beta-glucosidase/6-phospho-beta-glucosidase/beta-galactosidase